MDADSSLGSPKNDAEAFDELRNAVISFDASQKASRRISFISRVRRLFRKVHGFASLFPRALDVRQFVIALDRINEFFENENEQLAAQTLDEVQKLFRSNVMVKEFMLLLNKNEWKQSVDSDLKMLASLVKQMIDTQIEIETAGGYGSHNVPYHLYTDASKLKSDMHTSLNKISLPSRFDVDGAFETTIDNFRFELQQVMHVNKAKQFLKKIEEFRKRVRTMKF